MSRRGGRYRAGWLVGLTLFLAGCGERDMSDLERFIAQTRAQAPAALPEAMPEIAPYRPAEYTAFTLRDPFAPAPFVQQAAKAPVVGGTGVAPDASRPKEPLEAYALGSLKMVGTLQKNGLWALVKAPDGQVYRVTVGNYIGTNNGRIVRVSEARIDIREIVPDGFGGWKYQDARLTMNE